SVARLADVNGDGSSDWVVGSPADDDNGNGRGAAWVLFTISGTCGNGIVEFGEACDDSNTSSGDCCSPSCHFESSGSVCRTLAGICDVAETCTGSSAECPSDSLASPSTVCRGAAAVCDVAENCTGTSANCPANAVAA